MSGSGNGRPDPRRVEALFAAGLGLAPRDREALLERECAGDPELRREVASLLAAFDETDGVDVDLDAGRAVALVAAAGVPPRTIGPYRVVRSLGQGGMGTVYLAERIAGGFEQQVAVKLIKRGMDSEAILRRFHQERQILARLAHPNIARLLDGGVTDDGQPYFAMEAVEGEPITEYAARRRLDVESRLRLFLQVCAAVEQAHRHLVVHRDLKPSNVLVDREGRAKLVDFGIAKLLAADEAPPITALTRRGASVLTPEYASPEQIRGEAVTTASDVYGAGVVLYELLTDRLPYAGPLSNPEAVRRQVCDTEPLLASTAARREVPGETGRRLSRRLRGDLDSVLGMAIAKEVERRYPSIEALADDLRRHLAGHPVRARPPGAGYLARKFVRRHRVAVVASGSVLATLILGLGSTAWHASVAARERDRARQEAVKAREVTEFVLDLFAVAAPDTDAGETVTARELLGRGTERLQTELADQPEVRSEMLAVVGEIHRLLGLYDAAEPLLTEALALRRQVFGEDDFAVGASLADLAGLSYSRGEYAEAEALYRSALARESPASPAERAELARWLGGLSVTVRARGRYDEAETLARRALAIRRELLGPSHVDVAESLTQVAVPLYLLREYEPAERLYREALALRLELQGEGHREVAALRNRLGLLLKRQERFDEAETLFRQALATHRRLLGPEHPDTSMVLGNLASTRHAQGDLDGAEHLHREALAIQRPVLGAEHPDLAILINNLAGCLLERGDLAAAEPLYRESLAIWEKAHGERHPYVALALANLSLLLHERGDLEGALPLLRRQLSVEEELYGEDDERVVQTRRDLAELTTELDAATDA